MKQRNKLIHFEYQAFLEFKDFFGLLQEFEGMGYNSPQPQDENLSQEKMEYGLNSFSKKFSRK